MEKCKIYNVEVSGKSFPSKRISCVVGGKKFNKVSSSYFSYENLDKFSWKDLPVLNDIKSQLEEKLDTKYDYCLCHIYRDGKDTIGWHNDKEALDNDVASISFGATRKFRFRKISETRGYLVEYKLKSGDLLHMLPGCQRKYKHHVPTEASIDTPRINLTFRKLV